MLAALALVSLLATPPDSLVFRGQAGELEVQPPRLDGRAVRIDGNLDEPLWERAATLTGFSQYNPVEGRPAGPDETEVLVFYGDDAIYFGIRARQARREAIRANLGERDQVIFRTDWVRIMLDTYDDQRQAYVFYVNPLGSQGDGFWIEGLETTLPVPIDFNIDFIWDSAGHLTSDGWMAEVRIPYVSLRFPEGEEQRWGLNVAREARGLGYQWSWAPITADRTSVLAQGGRLVGMRGVRPRRLVEVNPVLTGKRIGERQVGGDFERGPLTPDFGANARYGLTRTLTLDATYNPDFSQVEADAGQIAINERFALFFPEKRPFFLDGTEIFNTPQRLVYTRAIVDPIGGAKLTGKVGSASVGYLGAVDQSPAKLGDVESEALFNLLRVRRDVGRGSTLGALFADRSLRDGSASNRVVGVDGRLLFGGRYSLTSQLAGSWTREGSAAGAGAGFGPLVHLQLQRAGRSLGWDLRFENTHPDFRARSGFVNRVGDARAAGTVRHDFFGPAGARIERWGTELRLESFFRHDDFWNGRGPEEALAELQGELQLRGKHTLSLTLRDGYFAPQPDDYAAHGLLATDGRLLPFRLPAPLEHLRGAQLSGRFQGQRATLSTNLDLREIPIYAEASRGVEIRATPTVQLRPTTGLMMDLSYSLSRLRRDDDGSRFSTAQIARAKAQYQFSRAFFVRAIGQYNTEERDALRGFGGLPVVRGGKAVGPRELGQFQYDLLVAYEPSPGTIVYAGWTRQMEGPYDRRVDELTPVAEGLFLKLSYLWRL